VDIKVKALIYKFSPIICHIPFLNIFQGRIKIDFGNKIMMRSKVIAKGCNNSICFRGRGGIRNCRFYIDGNSNSIIIEDNASVLGGIFHIEGNNNTIIIGKNTIISGHTQFACIEGTKIEIGDECLFSANITLRTGDSHSILDINGNRTNPSLSISVGNHVWIGNTVIITKGVSIEDNCVIGTGTVLTKSVCEKGVIVAGNPGRIVKKEINWDKKRI
jgi:acetyltransferase-like isoleucine patch superfamily enzyme